MNENEFLVMFFDTNADIFFFGLILFTFVNRDEILLNFVKAVGSGGTKYRKKKKKMFAFIDKHIFC